MCNIKVIENSDEAMDAFGHHYGSEIYEVTKEDIQALLDGKILATTINSDEYSIFIRVGKDCNIKDE